MHWSTEREARQRNLELEAAVKELLEKFVTQSKDQPFPVSRYDAEMEDFHQKIQDLEEQWAREKAELAKVIAVAEIAVIWWPGGGKAGRHWCREGSHSEGNRGRGDED